MEDAKQTVRSVLDEILADNDTNERAVKIERFDSGGANYTSTLFKAVVATPKNDLHLFAKVASLGESLREQMNVDILYTTEQFVYTRLAKIYDDLQNKHEVSYRHRFVFPKFYGSKMTYRKETIVTEDLSASGYGSYDRMKSMDWEHASVCVEELAKFHALSFAFKKEKPEEFEEIAKDNEYKLGSKGGDSMKNIWVTMTENSLGVIREEYRDRVRKIAYDEETMKSYNKPIERSVLTHGDFRLSNLLFKRMDGHLRAMVVDYQMVHTGSCVGDLIYFIAVGSDQEFRAQYLKQLIDHYHQHLTLALDRLSLDVAEVYPREVFDGEMNRIYPHMLIIGVMILPAVTVEAEAAPKLDGEDDINTFIAKPNKLYTERFRGLVDDCIQWGII